MRTTIRLDENLLTQAKEYAAKRGQTLTSVIAEALRVLLARQEKPQKRKRIALRTVKGRGVQPGVDLENWASVVAVMDMADVADRR
jgi:predicted DNA-binding ribbon-helix-helix protein